MLKQYSIFLIMLALSTENSFGFELILNIDGNVSNLVTGEKISLLKEQKIKIVDRNPRLIESPGRIPVLLVPASSDGGLISVNSPSTVDVIREAKDLKIDQELSDVLLKIGEIQTLMAEKKLTLALQKNSELKSQYPNVRYLDFFDASISFLLGDKSRAIASVATGLKAHPNFLPGLKLQESLGAPKNSKEKKAVEEAR